MTAAGRKGIPQVISVGALDMVNFGPPETIPPKFADRKFYHHNPTVTLMRTTAEENKKLGEEIARKAAAATGPTAILFPLEASQPSTAKASRSTIRRPATPYSTRSRRHHGSVELIELDQHINDPEFAETAALKLIELMRTNR